MKNIWLGMVLIFASCYLATAQNSAVQNFFERYENDPEFSVVEISPKMFELMARLDLEDENAELDKLITTITGLKILIKEGSGIELYNQAFKELSQVKFEELLKVRDDQENIRFMVHEDANKIINELILLVGGDSTFIMLDLTGNIDLKTIGKLGKAIDIPGTEHLEKLDKN